MYCRGIVVSSCLSRPNTSKNGSNFALVRLVGYFPDTLIYLAEIAVIFAILIQSIVTVTILVVTVTSRNTKRKFLPALRVFGSVKDFATITGSAGSVTFISGGTNILLSLPSLFIEGHSEISSEQANRTKLSAWLKELQRKEESNSHRTNRTERTTTERANPLG